MVKVSRCRDRLSIDCVWMKCVSGVRCQVLPFGVPSGVSHTKGFIPYIPCLVNRPGLSGAVLQTVFFADKLTDKLTRTNSLVLCENILKTDSQTVRPRAM